MKKLTLIGILLALITAPGLAAPTIEFSPSGTGWSYDGAGTFSFSNSIVINLVEGGTSDALIGSFVHISDLTVSGIPGGPYSLVPTGAIEIRDNADNVLLTGTLGIGNLVPIGTTGVAYADIKADITSITVANTIGSDALNAIELGHGMDFNLTIQSDSSIQDMLDSGSEGSNGMSGSMTIVTPAPGAVFLGSIGLCLVGWLRRRRTL